MLFHTKTKRTVYRIFLIGVFLSAFGFVGVSQKKPTVDLLRGRKGVLRYSEWAGVVSMHTNGVALGWRKSKIEKFYLNTFQQYEMANIRHPRELSRTIDPSGSGRGVYTFGKQNTLYVLRGGKGKVKYVSDKSRSGNVGIGWMYEGGITAGILKPYYLEVYSGKDGTFERSEIKYSEETEDLFLNPAKIVKHASFLKGITETKLIPGIHGQAALHFTFRGQSTFVLDLELGAKGDLFLRNIPMMVLEHNTPYFVSLFVSVQIGKRK